jgi:hypothetical protein
VVKATKIQFLPSRNARSQRHARWMQQIIPHTGILKMKEKDMSEKGKYSKTH